MYIILSPMACARDVAGEASACDVEFEIATSALVTRHLSVNDQLTSSIYD